MTTKEIIAEILADVDPEGFERIGERLAELHREAAALSLIQEVVREKLAGADAAELPGEVPLVAAKPKQLEPAVQKRRGRKPGPPPPSINGKRRGQPPGSKNVEPTEGERKLVIDQVEQYLRDVGEPCSGDMIAAGINRNRSGVFAALKDPRFQKTPLGYQLAQA